jgi:hypothetical protein
MDPLGWLSVVAGVAVSIGVLVDVFLTVLHPDMKGKIGETLQRLCWKGAVALGGRWQKARRQLLTLAGPLMAVLTFAVWVGLFILGVALIVWPNLGAYRAEAELGALGFVDALYYVGGTVTPLGYGDITPLGGPLQVLGFVAAGAGFVLLAGIVAYLVQLVASIDARHRLSLQVHDDTAGTLRGVHLPVRYLRSGNPEGLAARFREWASLSRQVQDKLHRYALTSIYYRSTDPVYDPETTFRMLGEALVAGRLLTSDERCKDVRLAVEEFDLALGRLLRTVGEQYLGKHAPQPVESSLPEVGDEDRRWVAEVRQHLHGQVGTKYQVGPVTGDAVVAAARVRLFLESLAGRSPRDPEGSRPDLDRGGDPRPAA